MVLFTVVPLFIVVYYALTDSAGSFTLDNLVTVSGYGSVFARSCCWPHLHRRLPHHRVPGGLFPLPAARQQAAHHADAGDAAHVDELPAPYLRMDGSAELNGLSNAVLASSASDLQHR